MIMVTMPAVSDVIFRVEWNLETWPCLSLVFWSPAPLFREAQNATRPKLLLPGTLCFPKVSGAQSAKNPPLRGLRLGALEHGEFFGKEVTESTPNDGGRSATTEQERMLRQETKGPVRGFSRARPVSLELIEYICRVCSTQAYRFLGRIRNWLGVVPKDRQADNCPSIVSRQPGNSKPTNRLQAGWDARFSSWFCN